MPVAEPTPALELAIVRRIAHLPDSAADLAPDLVRALIHDSLTGVYNRLYFQQRLELELSRVTPDQPLAMYVVDLNRLKWINDQFGHQTGDAAIREVAAALQAIMPPQTAVCRVGGDEFVALTPATDLVKAGWLLISAEREIARRKVAVGSRQEAIYLTASVGMAMAPADGTDAASLFARADQRMYLAKRSGLGAGVQTADPGQGAAPLVGQEELLATLASTLQRVQAGAGGLLVLTGAPGIGKTRLLQETGARARALGFRMLTLSLGEVGVGEHLRRLVGAVVRLAGGGRVHRLGQQNEAARQVVGIAYPTAETAAGPPTYGQIARVLQQLLAMATSRRPLLLLLDDLQAADPSLQAVLARLAGGMADLPVLMAAAARTGRIPADEVPGLAWLTGLPSCQVMAVPALGADAALKLAQWAVGQAMPGEQLRRLPAVRAGNPLLILRLATSGLLDCGEHASELAQLYAAQVERLPDRARAVLFAAAVLGQETRVEWLERVAPETPADLAAALTELTAAGWIQRDGHRCWFTHRLAGETAYAQMPAMLRRSLHRVAAVALSAASRIPPAVLARHCDAGGLWSEAQLHCLAAGVEAEAGFAYAEAARYLRRYLEWGTQLGAWPQDGAAVGLKVGRLFMKCDDFAAAAETLERSLALCRGDELRGPILLRLAYCQWHTGQLRQFAHRIRQSVRFLRRTGPAADLAECLAYLITDQSRCGNIRAIRKLGQEVLAVAGGLSDPALAMLWLAGAGQRLSEGGATDLAQACLTAAELRLDHLAGGADTVVAHGLMDLAVLVMSFGQVARALALVRRAGRYAAATGEPYEVMNAGLQEATWQVEQGYSLAARKSLRQLEPLVQRSNSRTRLGWWLAIAARECLYRHDLGGAERYAGLLCHLGAEIDDGAAKDGQALQARIVLAHGRRPAAEEWDAARLIADPWRSALATTHLLTGAAVLLAHGNTAAAAKLVVAARDRLTDPPEAAWADWTEGRVLLAEGQSARAAVAFQRATQGPKMGYFQAMAHRDLAELLLTDSTRKGTPEGVRAARIASHLRSARRLFQRLENQHELLRLRVLEAASVARGAPAEPATPTPSEQEMG